MKTFYLTDTGKVRSHNEDNVTILKNSHSEYMLIVADGMGGHRKGEVASAMAVNLLGKRFSKLSTLGTKDEAIKWLDNEVSLINQEILTHADSNVDSKGMGTTLVVAIYTNNYLLFGNIGDSSGFVLKNSVIHKVTKDHTLVNLLVDAGSISEEEAINHPKKNVLMKALGASSAVDMDIFDVDHSCEGIILCSDGLTNMLTVDQIEKVAIDTELSIEERVIKLIRKCNARGGTDNISVAILLNKVGE